MSSKKEKFLQDIHAIKEAILHNKSTLNRLALWIETPWDEQKILDTLLQNLGLTQTRESRYAAYMRIALLREDGLRNFLESEKYPKEEQNTILSKAYEFVEKYHGNIHTRLLENLDWEDLLTPFYRTLLWGAHDIGHAFNQFYKTWNWYLIEGINEELLERFGSQEGVKKYLSENDLLDRGHGGEIADRSYSVLVRDGDGYKRATYFEAFPEEISAIIEQLHILCHALENEQDDIFEHKGIFLAYFKNLEAALIETNPDACVEKWADVDTKWMEIKTPIQICHPFEWYEDRYRDAVSAEWDIRLQDTTLFDSTVRQDVEDMFLWLALELWLPTESEVHTNSLSNLERVQLYISHPFLYYGSCLNWLPSAQVIPNDNIVSASHGKKIFSFAKNRLEEERAKPKMQLIEEMLSQNILYKNQAIIASDSLFYGVYDVSTIGHEYGHTLWLESDTESVMNTSGNFKNIEEWKATTGGLMAFFLKQDESLLESVLVEHVIRSVKVMAWREITERVPYYTECLIHLNILFESGVVYRDTDGKIDIHISDETLQKLKTLYKKAYLLLAKTYITKEDASNFLYEFVVHEDGVFLPKNPLVRGFVEEYYKRYKEIGNTVAGEKIL